MLDTSNNWGPLEYDYDIINEFAAVLTLIDSEGVKYCFDLEIIKEEQEGAKQYDLRKGFGYTYEVAAVGQNKSGLPISSLKSSNISTCIEQLATQLSLDIEGYKDNTINQRAKSFIENSRLRVFNLI